MVDISILTMVYKPTNITGGHPPVCGCFSMKFQHASVKHGLPCRPIISIPSSRISWHPQKARTLRTAMPNMLHQHVPKIWGYWLGHLKRSRKWLPLTLKNGCLPLVLRSRYPHVILNMFDETPVSIEKAMVGSDKTWLRPFLGNTGMFYIYFSKDNQ